MVKVIHLAEDGTEMAAIEVIYSGLADMLREAASSVVAAAAPAELSREARLRRDKVLARLRG